jgi:segregation and condensation protein B
MKTKEQITKEKEREDKLKSLRKELEAELEEQLSAESLEGETKVDSIKVDTNAPLEPERAKQVLEALLFASSKPLTSGEIRKVLRGTTPQQIETWIGELKESYQRDGRSFEIREIAGGYEVATKKEFAPWILKIELQKKAKQATQSALETLAILAYKQPVTRAEVEALRGVDVSAVLTTLVERDLIHIVGRKEIPGRPFLYGTTDKFLEHFGLNSLGDLPNIDEIKTIVESSVKKEELLGRPQIVENTPENLGASPQPPAAGETENLSVPTSQETDRGSESSAQEN